MPFPNFTFRKSNVQNTTQNTTQSTTQDTTQNTLSGASVSQPSARKKVDVRFPKCYKVALAVKDTLTVTVTLLDKSEWHVETEDTPNQVQPCGFLQFEIEYSSSRKGFVMEFAQGTLIFPEHCHLGHHYPSMERGGDISAAIENRLHINPRVAAPPIEVSLFDIERSKSSTQINKWTYTTRRARPGNRSLGWQHVANDRATAASLPPKWPLYGCFSFDELDGAREPFKVKFDFSCEGHSVKKLRATWKSKTPAIVEDDYEIYPRFPDNETVKFSGHEEKCVGFKGEVDKKIVQLQNI